LGLDDEPEAAGTAPDNEERTLGDKLRLLQANSVEDLATFAKTIFSTSTQPTTALQAQAWAEAWAELWKSCAVRFDQLRSIVYDNA
jgi:hypothetical protein